MIKTTLITLFAAFGLIACATAPASQAVAPDISAQASSGTDVKLPEEVSQTAEITEVSDPDKKVCRSTEIIGSKFKKRVCATQAEWDEMEGSTKRSSEYIRKTRRAQTAQTGG